MQVQESYWIYQSKQGGENNLYKHSKLTDKFSNFQFI